MLGGQGYGTDPYRDDQQYPSSMSGGMGSSSGMNQGQGYGMGRGQSAEMPQGYQGTGQPGLQSHRGKGPKGYQRSDDRIREEVNDALEDEHGVDASDIEVQVQGGEVTLTGTVRDRQQKRWAEETVEHLRGVRDIHNQIRVQQGNQGGMGSLGNTSTPGTSSQEDTQQSR